MGRKDDGRMEFPLFRTTKRREGKIPEARAHTKKEKRKNKK